MKYEIISAYFQLMYNSYNGDVAQQTLYTQVHKPCIAVILTDLWDLTMYSNLLTLLNLTAEHFIGETVFNMQGVIRKKITAVLKSYPRTLKLCMEKRLQTELIVREFQSCHTITMIYR